MKYIQILLLLLCANSIMARTLIDSTGREVELPSKIERIVTGVPSNTELIIDMGLGERLVGIDENSENITGLPLGIKKIGRNEIDLEKVINLMPDLVILSSHNLVYGVEKYELLNELNIPFYIIKTPNSLEGVSKSITELGNVLNEKEKADALNKKYNFNLKKIEENLKNKKINKKIYFEISYNPIYTTGRNTFLNDVLEKAGGENIFKEKEGWLSPPLEKILEKNPHIIIISSDREKELNKIEDREGWEEIAAVKEKKIYVVDEGINRPSTRVLKSLKELVKILGDNK